MIKTYLRLETNTLNSRREIKKLTIFFDIVDGTKECKKVDEKKNQRKYKRKNVDV